MNHLIFLKTGLSSVTKAIGFDFHYRSVMIIKAHSNRVYRYRGEHRINETQFNTLVKGYFTHVERGQHYDKSLLETIPDLMEKLTPLDENETSIRQKGMLAERGMWRGDAKSTSIYISRIHEDKHRAKRRPWEVMPGHLIM